MKKTTNKLLQIDLARLKELGCLGRTGEQKLNWNRRGDHIASVSMQFRGNLMKLNYFKGSADGSKKSRVVENFFIDKTPCNFGGERRWFLCPSCQNRVRILYAVEYFRCRQCYELKYESQYENAFHRSIMAAQNIRCRLGGSANMSMPFPEKPKGMHWQTFAKLKTRHDNYANAGWAWCQNKYGLRTQQPLSDFI